MHLIYATFALQRTSAWSREEVVSAVFGLSTAIAIAYLVYRFVYRNPWPRPFNVRFAGLHILAAPAFAFAWIATSSILVALVMGTSIIAQIEPLIGQRMFIGIFMYIIVAGVSHAIEAAARAARAEALSARTQLAALRAQLHPHFLFNALHAIVQLIPVEPVRAGDAAELVADLLRATLEEQRDEVTLGDEWNFVSRYLAVERIRFGDRLVVRSDIPDALLDQRVPAFALQTLVENAVQHGAAPSVTATEIVVAAAGSPSELTISVWNSKGNDLIHPAKSGTGTGLARLRERMAVLYGSSARLEFGWDGNGGYEAVLVVPQSRARQS
jgi:two-component system LytT family sensor kinase